MRSPILAFATIALATLTLAACGAANQSSSTQSAGDHVVVDPIAAPGTIKGKVTALIWKCGGAASPEPQTNCSETKPYETEFAVAREVEAVDGPIGAKTYELVAWVKSDKRGNFSVKVKPGVYTLVQKFQITNDENDNSYLYGSVDAFTVAPGKTVKQDFRLMAPPPPISIGVGN